MVDWRDGDRWKTFESLPQQNLRSFELLAETKGKATFKLGKTVVANVDSGEWAPVRIRVAGNRKQVWLNNRVYADDVLEKAFAAGNLTCSQDLRNIRIRNLHLYQQ